MKRWSRKFTSRDKLGLIQYSASNIPLCTRYNPVSDVSGHHVLRNSMKEIRTTLRACRNATEQSLGHAKQKQRAGFVFSIKRRETSGIQVPQLKVTTANTLLTVVLRSK